MKWPSARIGQHRVVKRAQLMTLGIGQVQRERRHERGGYPHNNPRPVLLVVDNVFNPVLARLHAYSVVKRQEVLFVTEPQAASLP